MKFIWVFARWLLVGIAAVFLYNVAIAQAYMQVLPILLAILLLTPGLENWLTEKVPLLQSPFIRSFLGLSCLVFAVASFAMLTLQNSEDRIQQHMGLLDMNEIVRSQKFYYLEERGRFATSFEQLEQLELFAPSKYDGGYRYAITVNSSIPPSAVITATADPRYRLRSYTGILLRDEQKSDIESIICQTRFISNVPPQVPQLPDLKQQKLVCPANADAVSP
jgi:hypothetical protein